MRPPPKVVACIPHEPYPKTQGAATPQVVAYAFTPYATYGDFFRILSAPNFRRSSGKKEIKENSFLCR
jgi:hypothetical protein